jgi:hypothetical protein
MNTKSEHGQAAAAIALLLAILALALLLAGMAASQRGMQAGAEAIGNAAGNAIDSAPWDPGLEDQVRTAESAAGFRVNQQKLVPNRHSVERHGADAWAATNCYNNNGTFQVWRVGSREFHLLCRESDGSLFDIILRRRTNGSPEFDLTTCFRKEKGLRDALQWLMNKRAAKASVPGDITIYIDGVAP